MADNTKIWPIFRWANWWLSDDLFTGIKSSFYYSNNLEIRTDAKSVFPKPIPAYADTSAWVDLGTWENNNHNVKCVTYSDKDVWWIVCTDRYIYLVSGWTATQLCTMNETICDLEIFNWYIYVSTTDYVYYKKDNGSNWSDMASSTDNSVTNYWRCTDSLNNNGTHPLYASDICLCVWDENKMWKVTKEMPDMLQSWFELQEWWYIRFINELGWYIRIVAVDEPYGSEVILWNKIDTAPAEIIPLEWYSIIWAAIYWGYHYLLSNKGLGLLNWYQYYLLKKVDWDLETSTRNCMCVYDDKLYLIANDWIYIYWAKNKNYADVLNLWHKVEDWFKLWAIGAYKWWIMITRNYKYVSWWSNKPIRVGINEWLPYKWELQTMCYYWTSMSEIKQSMYLRVGYHLPVIEDPLLWTMRWIVRIYYRTEADAVDNNPDNWAWHDVWYVSQISDMRSPFATTFKLNCRFQWIQFKFELTNANANSVSLDTNLYSADLYYNTMLD